MSITLIHCKGCGFPQVYCTCRKESIVNKWIEYARESEASLLRNKGKHTIVKA